MSRPVAIAAAVVFAIGAAAAGYWMGTQRTPAPSAAAPGPASAKGGPQQAGGASVSVEATKVVTAPMPQTITAVGSLRSDESVTLRPESAGRISAITFQEGQRVAKGVPLVKLDPAIPEAEYAQAKANLTLAKA
jgi:membrane fusion protein (multidrug efflux system)